MSDNTNRLHINLHVYDMEIPVTINREDEELYRKIGVLISRVVASYMEKYKGLKSDKEIFYMALINIALRYGREAKRNDLEPLLGTLANLQKEIDELM